MKVTGSARVALERGRIMIDGSPELIMAGEVHYFRVPRPEWEQRLDRVVELGCDTVASYIPWLWHELPDGTIDVSGTTRPERDVGGFVDLCAQRGLRVLARPGPFVMAELKNEGLPYRVYAEHPEIVPVGWDGRPAPTRTVDYLAPAFLAEVERWYAAIMPVLAERLVPRGGPVLGVQLDNEIGMLAWVSNSPDLTDGLLADFRAWCAARDRLGRYPDTVDWATVVRSPDERWAAALRVDLGRFMRERFAAYVESLASSARAYGVDGVPFLVNIHGTEGGDGVPFAIGVSQLYRSYAGQPGFAAGADHYLGEISAPVAADLHFVNASMAAVNGPDQPLTSLEFEAGTGNYSGGLDALADPATVELKTRIALAQGNRLINYYLLAGGTNPPLDSPVGDGNDRISFTGERHGTGAPIGPEGQRGLAYEATGRAVHAARTHARWLAGATEEHDELAVGFWPDAFMTEYRYPGSAIMDELVADLRAFRGTGPRKALWRSLLFAGFRFSAVNLQYPGSALPRTVALSCGRVLDEPVQRRLVAHLAGGGSLLLLGRLPEIDSEARPCRALADALGLAAGPLVPGDHRYFPSVRGRGVAGLIPETRVGWLAELLGAGEPLLTDVDGRVCGRLVEEAGGPAVVLTAELPALPELFTALLSSLGCRPGLNLRTSVPGVLAMTSRTDRGERLLHLVNPTGYGATVRVDVGDPTGALTGPLTLPARSGAMFGLGLQLPGVTVLAANAELVALSERELRFGARAGQPTEVWLRIAGADPSRHSAPAGAELSVPIG